MGLAQRKPRVCVVCDGEFWAIWLYTKTCSRACNAVLRSRNVTTGKKVGEKAWKAALGPCCEACGAAVQRGVFNAHIHHVVYRQHVSREGGDEFDLRNAMTLCASCHARQHSASQRIPVSLLSVAAREFAVELLGEQRAADYFRRLYA